MDKVLNIAVYGSRRQQERAADVRRLLLSLAMDGACVAVHEKLYDALSAQTGLSLTGLSRVFACPAAADVILSIGGDGTFLRAVAWSECRPVPVLGVNTGHLGYLTALSLDEALARTGDILSLDFRHESLTMLRVDAPGLKGSPFALNEVVMAKEDSASMISAQAFLNGNLLADYKADGLIVATPTGSTAYNLSVGGPIVQPTAPVWVVSPIAAHSLTLRPLVVSDDSLIRVVVSGRGSRFRLVLDGRPSSLPMGTEVCVSKAPHRVTVLQRHDRDFSQIIGAKLLFNG